MQISQVQTAADLKTFIDRLAVETWQEPVGLFGHYEIYQREI